MMSENDYLEEYEQCESCGSSIHGQALSYGGLCLCNYCFRNFSYIPEDEN